MPPILLLLSLHFHSSLFQFLYCICYGSGDDELIILILGISLPPTLVSTVLGKHKCATLVLIYCEIFCQDTILGRYLDILGNLVVSVDSVLIVQLKDLSLECYLTANLLTPNSLVFWYFGGSDRDAYRELFCTVLHEAYIVHCVNLITEWKPCMSSFLEEHPAGISCLQDYLKTCN